MDWHDIEVNGGRTVNIADISIGTCQQPTHLSKTEAILNNYYDIGGIFKGGDWAWLVRTLSSATLQIVSLRNGLTVSHYTFNADNGFARDGKYSVRHVCEVTNLNYDGTILAIHLEYEYNSKHITSCIVLYSVDYGQVMRCIELPICVTAVSFLNADICRGTVLKEFDGCLALGSKVGDVLLLELNVKELLEKRINQNPERDYNQFLFTKAHIFDGSMHINTLLPEINNCRNENIPIAIQLERVDDLPRSVNSLLPIEVSYSLAVGYSDGNIVTYDLDEFFHYDIIEPQHEQRNAAVQHMCYLVPPDDPRPCYYICAMYNTNEHLTAALYAHIFNKRQIVESNQSRLIFLDFKSSAFRLCLLLEDSTSSVLNCQSVSTVYGDDNANSLCILSWYAHLEGKNKLLLFDLNQWYKREMPSTVRTSEVHTYMAGYVLNGQKMGLCTYILPTTVTHFNSMQRLEQHFYPNSLSFDCILLNAQSSRVYCWEGAQNRFINFLRHQNASIFLNPVPYKDQIIAARLLPNFFELQTNATYSKQAMYELILSVALEHNCHNLLRDCAKSWSDGSFTFDTISPTELSLSTLTNWIFKRAHQIKLRCNELCKDIYDYAGYPLDQHEQKELSFITRQLRQLTELQAEILQHGKLNLPSEALHELSAKQQAIRIATEYQEVVNWMLYIGLLPEASGSVNGNGARYPLADLRHYYNDRRLFFNKLSPEFIVRETGSCRVLYIDAFVEQCGSALRECWNGLYPPPSIESILHMFLVPQLDFEEKCSLLLYFLLDLNSTLDENIYHNVLIHFSKFQNVFKLTSTAAKTIETFWHLDHKEFLRAVEDFITPLNKSQNFAPWQVELLIEALLLQNAGNQALCILDARPALVSPLIKLKTLLANEMITEAFHYARDRNAESKECLLEYFFRSCILAERFDVLRDLTVSEQEGHLIERLLADSKHEGAVSLHFVYLLQRSKYLEAVTYMDEKSRTERWNAMDNQSPNAMLSAYNCTVPPVTQNITDIYFRIRNTFRPKENSKCAQDTFSAQLIKQNANTLLGGIYHSSALSAHFATRYWGDMQSRVNTNSPLSAKNAPFLRPPQNETNYLDLMQHNIISRPRPYQPAAKRPRECEQNQHPATAEISTSMHRRIVQPPKRRRLLGEQIIDDLKHFMEQRNKNVTDQPVVRDADILMQPVPRTTVSALQQDRYSRTASPMPKVVGILKTATPEPQQQQTPRDEKNLRFQLPTASISETEHENDDEADVDPIKNNDNNKDNEQDNSYSQSFASNNIETDITMETSQSGTDSDEIIVALEHEILPSTSSYSSVKASMSASTIQNVIANRSKRYSSESDEFYSPNVSCQLESSMTIGQQQSSIDMQQRLSGPKSRRSLADVREEQEQEQQQQQLSSRISRISSSITTTSTTTSLSQHQQQAQFSSGFGSFEDAAATAIATSSRSSQMQSQLHEFVPPVCSSKVAETQSKFSQNVKFSECTTVIGTFNSDMNVTEHESGTDTRMPTIVLDQTTLATTTTTRTTGQMLDTTLSMSTYDVTVFDTTTNQYTRPHLPVAPSELTLPNDDTSELAAIDDDDDDDDDEQQQQLEKQETETAALKLNKRKSDSGSGTTSSTTSASTSSSDSDSGNGNGNGNGSGSRSISGSRSNSGSSSSSSSSTISDNNDDDDDDKNNANGTAPAEADDSDSDEIIIHSFVPGTSSVTHSEPQNETIPVIELLSSDDEPEPSVSPVPTSQTITPTSATVSTDIEINYIESSNDDDSDNDNDNVNDNNAIDIIQEAYDVGETETGRELMNFLAQSGTGSVGNDDVVNVGNDVISSSSTNSSSLSSSPGGQFENGSRMPRGSLYRANSLETVTELDTTKESTDEDKQYDNDDDECVVALDGTEVRQYVPPVDRSTTTGRTVTVEMTTETETETTTLSANVGETMLQHEEEHRRSSAFIAYISPDTVVVAERAQLRVTPSPTGTTSSVHTSASTTSSSISNLSDGDGETMSNGASSLPGSIDTSPGYSNITMEHEHLDDSIMNFSGSDTQALFQENERNQVENVIAISRRSVRAVEEEFDTTIREIEEDVELETAMRENEEQEKGKSTSEKSDEKEVDNEKSHKNLSERIDDPPISDSIATTSSIKSIQAAAVFQSARSPFMLAVVPEEDDDEENPHAKTEHMAVDQPVKIRTRTCSISQTKTATPRSTPTRRSSTSLMPDSPGEPDESNTPQLTSNESSPTISASTSRITRSRYSLRGTSIEPATTPSSNSPTSQPGTPSTRKRYMLRGSSADPSTSASPTGTKRTRGQSAPPDELTPASASTTSTTARSKRGGSVPLSTSSNANLLTPTSKSILLRRQLLEAITEDGSNTLDSPAQRTRSRQRLNSGSSDVDHLTPLGKVTKRVRTMRGTPVLPASPMVEAEDSSTDAGTPKRRRRSQSVASTTGNKQQKTAKQTGRHTNDDGDNDNEHDDNDKDEDEDENDDIKSTSTTKSVASSKKTREKKIATTTTKRQIQTTTAAATVETGGSGAGTASTTATAEDGSADYLSTRRLTRTQEKFAKMSSERSSAAAAATSEATHTRIRLMKRRMAANNAAETDAVESDLEDNASEVSAKSSAPSQRSKRRNTRAASTTNEQTNNPDGHADETATIGSAASDDIAQSAVPPKKRGRPKKQLP